MFLNFLWSWKRRTTAWVRDFPPPGPSHLIFLELDIQSTSIKLDVQDEIDQHDFFALQGDGWSTESSIEGEMCFDFSVAKWDLRVPGVHITATRLFGPKPQALTYLCLWSFEVGSVAIELPAFRIKHLELVFQTFMSNFKDNLNTPAADLAVKSDPDSKFKPCISPKFY